VAERYTQTAVGALLIFPNANLKRERGWAAEIGIKQAVKISKGWKGIFDVSGFVNQYDDMVEFTFGNYIPYEDSLSGNTSSPWYFMNWLGFSAQNAESATIAGFEFSFNSVGKIGEVELLSLLGYTYMNPISKNTDSEYLQTLSTYEQTIDPVSGDTSISYNDNLKYRFNHLIRADIEATWKLISLGISCRYNSFMTNIDALFEDGFAGQQILPGLKQYRQINNKGGIVFDVRAAYSFKEHYRVSLMVNNFLNAEYEARPGDIQAPATFIAQLQMKF
jgi:iron complex outermembrane receptor protein